MYNDCPYFLKDFLLYLETIKGHSKKTVSAYYIDLKLFIKFLSFNNNKDTNINFNEEIINIKNIDISIISNCTVSDIYEYLHYITNERNNSAKTRARKISSLKTFFKYLEIKSNLIKNNPLKEISPPSLKKSLPKYLTLEQSIELLKSTKNNFSSRDYCILVLFLNCGMRLTELVNINIYDIKNDNLKLLGKGNKERIVYLNDICVNAINEYLKERYIISNLKDKNALFISKQGKRITQRRVQQIIENILKHNGLSHEGFSPHKLRHTAATLMYQYNNVDIRILKDILGHENISTTEIYTHVSNSQVKDAMKNSPLNKIINKK